MTAEFFSWKPSHARPFTALASGSALFFAIACASPTLPLPPPEAPTVLSGADADHVRLVADQCGGAEANSVIVVINQNPTVALDLAVSGALTDNCGRWDTTVYAHSGDGLLITQEAGDTRSTPLSIVVR